MSETVTPVTKWIDWHPKPGDVRPERYRYRYRHRVDSGWSPVNQSHKAHLPISEYEAADILYQIPAPEETAMKYWQPRVEPMQRAWTLADVPDDVLCEVQLANGVSFYADRDGHRVYSRASDSTTETTYKPSECRVIRVIDPIPPGAMTLDKVPEGVNCEVLGEKYECNSTFIARRSEAGAFYGRLPDSLVEDSPAELKVLFILDPIPEVAYTLETLPVGRVIEIRNNQLWKDSCQNWLCKDTSGRINDESHPVFNEFTVTDYIMELKEVV